MSAFIEARTGLAEDLEAAGFHVENHMPENVVPPLVFIRPVRPPVTPYPSGDGMTFTYRVGLVMVADESPEGPEAIDAIETMLENVLAAMDWDIEEVDAPVAWNSPANGRFPAIAMVISKTITIKGGI